MIGDAFERQARDAADKPPIEVRILDGPLKGQARFVRIGDVARMIPKPVDPNDEYRERRKLEKAAEARAKEEARAKANAPEAKAATMLQVARNLEKDGKVRPALEAYRKIVKDFPGTAAARASAERIKAIPPP